MKKIIALTLCLVLLLLSFSGCTPKEDASQLLVGYGRASIVPEYSMPLKGYPGSDARWFTNVMDPIYATALAFSDSDGNTVILIQLDLADAENHKISVATKDISETFGIPRSNIIVSATHTHSAPTHSTIEGMEFISTEWGKLLQKQIVAAATEAMESRLPAEIYASSIETTNMNFVRHYVLDDGSVVGDNFGSDQGRRYVRHAQKADTELQVLRFKREGGKDIVVANFQSHPHKAGSPTSPDLTSDYIGPMTTYVEKNMDCHFAYFSGASGNVNPFSRIPSENITNNHVEHGEALGRYTVLACTNMKKLDSGAVQCIKENFVATAIRDADLELPMIAFSIGDVGFINVPYEMFCSNGKYVKDNSPFAMTIVTTLGITSSCYMPDAATFAYDITSYEETLCPYTEGTGELLAEGFVRLLNQLHSTTK